MHVPDDKHSTSSINCGHDKRTTERRGEEREIRLVVDGQLNDDREREVYVSMSATMEQHCVGERAARDDSAAFLHVRCARDDDENVMMQLS
jgi:hypothetical protein